MAITLEPEFILDRMIDDIIYLPFTSKDIFLPAGGQASLKSFNTSINKLYANMKFLYSYSSMYRPIMNDSEIDNNPNYQKYQFPYSNIKASAITYNKFSNQVLAFVAFDTHVIVKIFNFVNNTMSVAGEFVIDNVWYQDSKYAFVSVLDMKIDGNYLYVLDSDNIYKIDISLYVGLTNVNEPKKIILANVTQGYKDILKIEGTGITFDDKVGPNQIYKNIKITVSENYVLVLDNTYNFSKVKIFNKNLTYIKTIDVNIPYPICSDIDYKDGYVTLLTGYKEGASNYLAKFSIDSINNSHVNFIITPLCSTVFYRGLAFSGNSNVFYGSGGGYANSSFRIYRSFISKSDRIIDSVAQESNVYTNDLTCVDNFYLPDDNGGIDFVISNSSNYVFVNKINTKLISCVEDFEIFNLVNASVAGDEYHSYFVYNKTIFKYLLDNINFLKNIIGQFNGQIISTKKENGIQEIKYINIQYPDINIINKNYDALSDDYYIYSAEIFDHHIINRSFEKVLDIQQTILENIRSNLGNLVEIGIEIG